MVLHPDVQAKAQADIDRVVGQDRLPDFDDRPALPYLDAILQETLRWYPVAPMGPYAIPLFFNYLMDSLRRPTRNNDKRHLQRLFHP
jgi:hypothetical protein